MKDLSIKSSFNIKRFYILNSNVEFKIFYLNM